MRPVACIRLLSLAVLLVAPVVVSAQTLSVDELLQSPRQFEGRRVSVRGFYYSDSEGHMLYADRDAVRRHDTKRSIWIEADPPVYNLSYRDAHIIGVFFHDSHAKPPLDGYGAFGLWTAKLINCTVHLRRETISAPNQTMQRTPTRRSPKTSHDKIIPPPINARSR
jgi:hypothetical protein